MSEKMTLARPYAEAVFALAKERSALPQWSQMLQLAALIAGDAQMYRLFDDPRLPRERLIALFLDVAGKSLSDDGVNLIRLLAANRRLALLPEIAHAFEELKAEHERAVDAEITSAYPLDAAQLQKIIGALKQRLGRDVRPLPKVDPSLIGGVIVRAGDVVIDGSVEGRLRALSSYLYR
jgi:F-type H+-transporting ATPase subunit delta